MLRIIKERLHQGHRTLDYPRQQPVMPPRFCGRPSIDSGLCPPDCRLCHETCPTGALTLEARPETPTHSPAIDMGRCLFCAQCRDACPAGRIHFTPEHRLATRTRADLWVRAGEAPLAAQEAEASPEPRDLRLFARSFKLRQVSVGGCNACEADCNVLTTPVFDLGRFGIDFVASPRHADALLVTGPVSENMRLALLDSYEALPAPRVVIAAGACAISGGLFAGSPECHDGVSPGAFPFGIDVFIPGCPPHPWTILDGLLLPFNGR